MSVLLALMLLWQDKAATDAACIKCHEDQGAEVKASVHESRGIGCVKCHGTDEIAEGRHRMLPTFKPSRIKAASNDCGSCHKGVLLAFTPSEHFESAAKGEGDPKTKSSCSSCHGHHDVARADRQVIQKKCLACHEATSGNYEEGVEAFRRISNLEASMVRLADRAIKLDRRPGIDVRDAKETFEMRKSDLAEFRIVQHGIRFHELKDRATASSVSTDEAYNQLEQREREFGRRYVYLIPLLVLVAISAALVAVKSKRGTS